jgi:tRNA-uridine 2-sulfurtransferase
MGHFPQIIGVAMSGGVDSTTTAALLQEQGWQVEGFFMLLQPNSEEQAAKVQVLAQRLGIPLHLVDLRQQFHLQVIQSFTAAYQQGLTPNPCILCNRLIKFGLLMEAMLAQGMDSMATGHYARVEQARLYRGLDPNKDQSYFLCRLLPEQLARLVLPLGTWKKQAVFQRAKDLGFTHFDGSESQDVCFLGEQTLAHFLSQQGLSARTGVIQNTEGKILGEHQGIWHYTVGQRRGLGLPDASPWYVTALDAQRNVVIVGKNDALFHQQIVLRDMQWQGEAPPQWQGLVQVRSRHQPTPAHLVPQEDGLWQVCLDTPQRAITPGQFAVLYEADQVVASGVIHHAQ